MASRRSAPTVNAGSMADIAFLLLIFFLVTTTISADKGILRQLPADCPTNDCTADIAERNILKILINRENNIMVDDEAVGLNDIKNMVMAFIDNNGKGNCDYCNGNMVATLSDHPSKAIISLKTDPKASYQTFIAIQDEISKAYLELRLEYSKNVFNKPSENLSKTEILELREAYPFKLSEAETR